MSTVNYDRKPSKPQLLAAIRAAMARGERELFLQWGENRIELERSPSGWYGYGWIGRHGGDDLVREVIRRNT